jgi:hypothetical protein
MPVGATHYTARDIEQAYMRGKSESDAIVRLLSVQRAVHNIQITYLTWERKNLEPTATELAGIEGSIVELTDDMANQWGYKTDNEGRRQIRPLHGLIDELHVIFPEAGGWISGPSSSSSSASSSITVAAKHKYRQIILHIHLDKIPASDDMWLRKLKSSVYVVLNNSCEESQGVN